jgi:hypothetical protein
MLYKKNLQSGNKNKIVVATSIAKINNGVNNKTQADINASPNAAVPNSVVKSISSVLEGDGWDIISNNESQEEL